MIQFVLILATLAWVNTAWAQAEAGMPKPEFVPFAAEGVINGTDCYAKEQVCSLDEQRAKHAWTEKDWILMNKDGVFHLANLGSDVKILHAGHTVKVTGKLDKVSGSIFVKKMDMLMKNGKFETVWTEHDHVKAVKDSSWFSHDKP